MKKIERGVTHVLRPVFEQRKPTPDQLRLRWPADHPAVKLVDELLGNRSEEVVSYLDKLWWYEIAERHLASRPSGEVERVRAILKEVIVAMPLQTNVENALREALSLLPPDKEKE